MAITAAQVKELREMTGAGMMDAKKALTETDGDMEAAIPLSGQVAGRIDSVKPVEKILEEIKKEFFSTIESLSQNYL